MRHGDNTLEVSCHFPAKGCFFCSFGITLKIVNFFSLGTVSLREGNSNVLFTLRGFEEHSHIEQYVNSILPTSAFVILNVTGSIHFRIQNFKFKVSYVATYGVGLGHTSLCRQ